ncbi:hypothetical protein Q0Z83_067290 [Actinoplanes sichuanensis]|uniref:Uncharacterized protein n=1 Tax=Actinoplanes sichuanensis TaxID=512349 RepID=A0ABW4AUD5_9ACTN|nr:hypothetical protein [Actinoplanes sichuanensis]BEL08538.1 hypothetical protein Q0Z83_067290 [Actinoplanes sichuanensis]
MSTATYAPTNPATALGDPMRSAFGGQFLGTAYGPGFGLDPLMGQYGQQFGQQVPQYGQQFGQQVPQFGQQFGQQAQYPFQQQHLQHAIAQHVQQAIANQVQQAQIQQAIAQQIQHQQIQQAIAQQIQQQQIQQAIARHWQQGHPGAMYGGIGSPYGQQMWN